MPLMDRLEARRRAVAGDVAEPMGREPILTYAELAMELAHRVARLSPLRSHSDRARVLRQLTDVDALIHSMLDQIGRPPSVV